MANIKGDKIERTLRLYQKLMEGDIIDKSHEAARYGVNERSIQRDIEDIRNFLEDDGIERGCVNSVIYDRSAKGYRLEKIYQQKLSNSEVLAVCKILLDSRAFGKSEISEMLDKLIKACVPKTNQKIISELIGNEAYHYVELRHKTKFLDNLWILGQAIRSSNCVEASYHRLKGKKIVKRRLKPVGIMFSEFYFYLLAFIDDSEVRKNFEVKDDLFPTIYRLDRIKSITVDKEHFRVPYLNRFEEGEFRKRVQFMYGGKLQTVRFKYSGMDVDAILDRLPTAQIISDDNGVYTISAEVFGKGVDMWLKSQGDNVEILN